MDYIFKNDDIQIKEGHIIFFKGSLQLKCYDEMKETLSKVLSNLENQEIIFDVSEVQFINSGAIRFFMSLMTRYNTIKYKFRFAGELQSIGFNGMFSACSGLPFTAEKYKENIIDIDVSKILSSVKELDNVGLQTN